MINPERFGYVADELFMCFVCASPGKAIPKMTYTVSGGMLNPTHSLTH